MINEKPKGITISLMLITFFCGAVVVLTALSLFAVYQRTSHDVSETHKAMFDEVLPSIRRLEESINIRLGDLEDRVNNRLGDLEENVDTRLGGLEENVNTRLGTTEEKVNSLEGQSQRAASASESAAAAANVAARNAKRRIVVQSETETVEAKERRIEKLRQDVQKERVRRRAAERAARRRQ
jgi:hypothetical protein